MAQIPRGDFGQAIARPGPRANIPQGNPIGQAIGQVLDQAGQIVNDAAQQQTRLDLEQKRVEQQARDEAERAQALVTMNGTKDKLTDLTDEINAGVIDGSVPKDDAPKLYAQRSSKLVSDATQALPLKHRDIGSAELTGTADRFGNTVRKAVLQRDRQDVTSGITQTLEYLQRQYKTDPGKATEQMAQTVDALGPHSTFTPDQLGKLKQTWRENTQFTTGFELVSAGRDNRAALDAAEKAISQGLPDLDPQKRAQLGDRIAAYRLSIDQRENIKAERLAREGERRLKVAEAAFQTFQALADKGGTLAPDYIDQVMATTAGTPYQAGIRTLAQQARETGGLAAQTPEALSTTLRAIDQQIAAGGRTPEMDKRRGQVERVLSEQKRDIETDAMSAALERGVVTKLEPINMAGGLPAYMQALEARRPEAERAAVWAGRPVSPMTADEAAAFKHQLDSLPVKERAGVVAGLAQKIGPQAAQGLAQQWGKESGPLALAMASAGDMTTAGRYTSELILRGAQAKQDGTSTKGSKQPEVKVAGWQAQVAEYIGDAYTPEVAKQIREAAVLISHGIASEQGGELSTADIQRAARMAMGGDIIDHNGKRTPIPAGMDADAFESRLRALKPADIGTDQVIVGGKPMSADQFLRMVPIAPLMPVSKGRYAPLVGGRPALLPNGQPVVIGVR